MSFSKGKKNHFHLLHVVHLCFLSSISMVVHKGCPGQINWDTVVFLPIQQHLLALMRKRPHTPYRSLYSFCTCWDTSSTGSLINHVLPTSGAESWEREARLTGHTVDCFQGSQDTDSTDCRQVNVLEIQGVLHHPVGGEREGGREKKKKSEKKKV